MVKTISRLFVVGCMVAVGLTLPAQAAMRVLYVDSYHQGYAWSDSITEAIKTTLEGEDAFLQIYHMDTIRNKSEALKKKAALRAREVISSFRPDIVITSDDNASKYLIMSYYKDVQLPFVFCGVDNSADAYGFPYSNVTGMLEVPPTIRLVYSLKHFTRILRVGYLAGDTPTDRKNGSFNKRVVREDYIEHYVKTFDQWKRGFDVMQDVVDVIIVGNNAGIKGWSDDEARRFAENNTRIPTGCLLDLMAPVTFLSATVSATEHGTYAAKTALKIIKGTPVSAIPICSNVNADIIINLRIAKKLNKEVPESFKKMAKRIIE